MGGDGGNLAMGDDEGPFDMYHLRAFECCVGVMGVVVVSFVIGSVTSLLSAFDRKKFDKVGAYRSK